MGTKISVLPVYFYVQQDSNQAQEMVFIALLMLHHALHMVVHRLVFRIADSELIDCAIRTAVKGVDKVLVNEPRNKRVVHFFLPKLYTSRNSLSKAIEA